MENKQIINNDVNAQNPLFAADKFSKKFCGKGINILNNKIIDNKKSKHGKSYYVHGSKVIPSIIIDPNKHPIPYYSYIWKFKNMKTSTNGLIIGIHDAVVKIVNGYFHENKMSAWYAYDCHYGILREWNTKNKSLNHKQFKKKNDILTLILIVSSLNAKLIYKINDENISTQYIEQSESINYRLAVAASAKCKILLELLEFKSSCYVQEIFDKRLCGKDITICADGKWMRHESGVGVSEYNAVYGNNIIPADTKKTYIWKIKNCSQSNEDNNIFAIGIGTTIDRNPSHWNNHMIGVYRLGRDGLPKFTNKGDILTMKLEVKPKTKTKEFEYNHAILSFQINGHLKLLIYAYINRIIQPMLGGRIQPIPLPIYSLCDSYLLDNPEVVAGTALLSMNCRLAICFSNQSDYYCNGINSALELIDFRCND